MTAARLALASFLVASTLSGLLVALIHVSGADPWQVWQSFRASLGPQLGAMLSIVVVTFVGILFTFSLGWIALRLFGVLALEALGLITRPVSNAVSAAQDLGGAAVRKGGALAQGALDGAAVVGNAAIDLANRGAQYVPGLRAGPDGNGDAGKPR